MCSNLKQTLKHGVKITIADVRITTNGDFVCWHDETLQSPQILMSDGSALSEENKALQISEFTLTQIDQFDFGIYKGPQYARTKTLRLDDFLKWCSLTNCYPFLENKVKLTEANVIAMAMLIKAYKFDRYIFVGENHNSAVSVEGFYYVYSSGYLSSISASVTYGVVPASA